jgi:hypothetical protein
MKFYFGDMLNASYRDVYSEDMYDFGMNERGYYREPLETIPVGEFYEILLNDLITIAKIKYAAQVNGILYVDCIKSSNPTQLSIIVTGSYIKIGKLSADMHTINISDYNDFVEVLNKI